MSQLAALPLASADLGALRERVRLMAENRPAVYRMTDPAGRVLYVGKAQSLRVRIKSYFRDGGDGRASIQFLLQRSRSLE